MQVPSLSLCSLPPLSLCCHPEVVAQPQNLTLLPLTNRLLEYDKLVKSIVSCTSTSMGMALPGPKPQVLVLVSGVQHLPPFWPCCYLLRPGSPYILSVHLISKALLFQLSMLCGLMVATCLLLWALLSGCRSKGYDQVFGES